MAGYDFEFYETGRISVTAGQKAFTGSGTAWKLRGCEGALVIVAGAGAVNFVSALTTDAAGEFRTAWTGPTLSNVQYTMWLPSAVAATALANHQRLAEIIASIQAAQPESANLTALAGLNGDAETLVRFLANGAFDLVKASEVVLQDPNGTLAKFAALTVAANKALTTDGSGNAQQIDLGTLGRALLALASGTTAQYVQGDGTLQAKAGLPISTATQSALNNKLSTVNGQPNTIRTFNIDNFDDKSGIYIKSSRPNGASGQTNFSGPVDFAIGSSQIRGSVSLFERIGTESVLSFNVGYYNSQQWFEMTNAGGFRVPGALTAGSKSFKIDHVKDPYNKYLVYMSTEAPKAGIEDWGSVRLVSGQAEVDLDIAAGQMSGTFAALTQRAIVVSVNNLDSHTRVHAGRITDGKFTIFADDPACDDEVTWTVKAERADPFIKSHPYCDPVTGRLIPQHEKED